MIPPIQTPWEPDIWRRELRQAIRSSQVLLDELCIKDIDVLQHPDFAVLVPRIFAARMQIGAADDPLLRQVLAQPAETVAVAGFANDPLAETDRRQVKVSAPGLIHKYQGRALLITTSGCAINCRYCFRRHFPYAEHREQGHTQALQAIRLDTSLREVILSGGDPLLLDDRALLHLLRELDDIGHVERVRIHSRIPIVLPQRITAGLVDVLQSTNLRLVLVVHSNHANELDHNTARALAVLKQTGLWILNQSVLLRGVNDKLETLVALSEKLFDQGVQPYYLHMPDHVAGTAHFFVEDKQAITLYKGMQAQLPGYLVPKLVREIPGEPAKQFVQAPHI